jgi:myo-inositol-1(or 4)-monophosphatase
VELARVAGARVLATPASAPVVQFKPATANTAANSNPVSELDRDVERLVQAALSKRYPQHVVIGEELEHPIDDDAPFVWTIDPLDGTTNYLNGLPLFAVSIGVLYRHVPVAGAIWCSVTHQFRSGIYHAHHDGALHFDGVALERRALAPWRGLASEPGDTPHYAAFFDTRVLAAAALECALVAAGVLRVAYVARPAIWDVAAGIALANAAGCRVLTQRDGVWTPFSGFSARNARKRNSSLRGWHQPILIGEPRALERELAVATALD